MLSGQVVNETEGKFYAPIHPIFAGVVDAYIKLT